MFIEHVNILPLLMRIYGNSAQTSTKFTTVSYRWSKPRCVLVLEQMADANGISVGTWTEKATWTPPVEVGVGGVRAMVDGGSPDDQGIEGGLSPAELEPCERPSPR